MSSALVDGEVVHGALGKACLEELLRICVVMQMLLVYIMLHGEMDLMGVIDFPSPGLT